MAKENEKGLLIEHVKKLAATLAVAANRNLSFTAECNRNSVILLFD